MLRLVKVDIAAHTTPTIASVLYAGIAQGQHRGSTGASVTHRTRGTHDVVSAVDDMIEWCGDVFDVLPGDVPGDVPD